MKAVTKNTKKQNKRQSSQTRQDYSTYYTEPVASSDNYISSNSNFSQTETNDFSEPNISNYELSTPIDFEEVEQIDINSLKSIHKSSDDSIDWTEILVSPIAPDDTYNQRMWSYYHSVAAKVLAGDIDTYLQLIYEINPLNDLLMYGGNFEFGTDDSKKIEVEFNINEDALSKAKHQLSNTEYNLLLQDYVCSVCIRVARDMLALLPIRNVIVHAVSNENTILSVDFDRQTLSTVKFGYIDPSDTLKLFRHNMDFNESIGFSNVATIE